MAAPRKITDAQIQSARDYIAGGGELAAWCRAAGISYQAMQHHIKPRSPRDGVRRDFEHARNLREAEARRTAERRARERGRATLRETLQNQINDLCAQFGVAPRYPTGRRHAR